MGTQFLSKFLTSRLVVIVGGLLVAIVLSYEIGYYSAISRYKVLFHQISPIRDQSLQYRFTKPLLGYSFPETSEIEDYAELETELKNRISSARTKGVTQASIYFRDLEGSWKTSINQESMYAPASLLKVPTLIAYYAYAEKNPSVLTEKLVYVPELLPSIPFGTESHLVSDRTYSVSELIRYMISESDNAATMMLLQYIDDDFLRRVYVALGISEPDGRQKEYLISARAYGLFFRVLYNATYLSPEYSDKALALLADTTFTEGLVAGIPPGIKVAHKWGEHVRAQDDVAIGVDLHDCGVVYYPDHPYLLCVMTSATNVDKAKEFIATVSSVTYAAVDKRYGK